ncbi:hypothetical protein [Actinomadura rupiterrae]|uniref:hypothetical protein n=1 Tax=Actinomadura rupiterrae TaxID=559627 RepID=UPI0020A428AE|nr:hypothetical protein [Actinomadura rupiterrae]MCP2339213.1 hypothetical protein [Actinomadura rupiterrae]
MSRTLQPCGTRAAYKRHKRRGEQPCEPCRQANAAYIRPTGSARHRALKALAERHAAEYDALYRTELARSQETDDD